MAGKSKQIQGIKKSWDKARRLAKKLGIGTQEARSRIAADKKPTRSRATANGDGWNEVTLVAASALIQTAGGAKQAKEAVELMDRLMG